MYRVWVLKPILLLFEIYLLPLHRFTKLHVACRRCKIATRMKNRIYQLMKQQSMSQKEFAGELCIAEGTLSSVFSGRTKPSNNIVQAIHERFPEVSIPWLMFGEGEMLAQQGDTPTESTPSSTPSIDSVPQGDLFQGFVPQFGTTVPVQEVKRPVEVPQRRIVEIKVFYDDGTFQTFS